MIDNPGNGSIYWFHKDFGVHNVRGFVTLNASDLRAGPAGVVMKSTDVAGVSVGGEEQGCGQDGGLRHSLTLLVPLCSPLPQLYDKQCAIYNTDASRTETVLQSSLQFKCDLEVDFALATSLSPKPWMNAAFNHSPLAQSKFVWQCPEYVKYYPVGGDQDKPAWRTCGLRSTEVPTESYQDQDLPYLETRAIIEGNGRCFTTDGNQGQTNCDLNVPAGNCPDGLNGHDGPLGLSMDQCAGQGRMDWPFFSGAYVGYPESPATRCYTPATPANQLPRLPVLDIKNIPVVTSPHTGKPYCTPDGKTRGGVKWRVPASCGHDATRAADYAIGSMLTAIDTTSWPVQDAVNNTASHVVVALAPDKDLVTCSPVGARRWVETRAQRRSSRFQQNEHCGRPRGRARC